MKINCKKCIFKRKILGSSNPSFCEFYKKGKKSGQICPVDECLIRDKEKGAWRPDGK